MAHLILVVPRLSRVALNPDDPPPDYPSPAGPWDVAALDLMVLGCACALWRVPAVQLPPWFGYLGVGGALVWVDFKTTWLPKHLHWTAIAQVMTGLAVAAVHPPGVLIAALAGVYATSGVFWLVWRFSESLGFGDVRFGLLVGTAAGLMSLQAWTTALLAGILIGAGQAIVHALHGRASEPFPYDPSL